MCAAPQRADPSRPAAGAPSARHCRAGLFPALLSFRLGAPCELLLSLEQSVCAQAALVGSGAVALCLPQCCCLNAAAPVAGVP